MIGTAPSIFSNSNTYFFFASLSSSPLFFFSRSRTIGAPSISRFFFLSCSVFVRMRLPGMGRPRDSLKLYFSRVATLPLPQRLPLFFPTAVPHRKDAPVSPFFFCLRSPPFIRDALDKTVPCHPWSYDSDSPPCGLKKIVIPFLFRPSSVDSQAVRSESESFPASCSILPHTLVSPFLKDSIPPFLRCDFR